jgi:hypothetical protein
MPSRRISPIGLVQATLEFRFPDSPETRADHADYTGQWLNLLGQTSGIFSAAYAAKRHRLSAWPPAKNWNCPAFMVRS